MNAWIYKVERSSPPLPESFLRQTLFNFRFFLHCLQPRSWRHG